MSLEFNWEPIGNYVNILSGFAFKSKDFIESGVPVIKIKNIVPPDVVLNDVQYVSDKFLTEKSNYVLNKGDILITLTGSNVNQMASAVGQVAKINFSKPSLLNQRVAKLIPKDKTKCNIDYFYYILSTEEMHYNLASRASGSANQANINPTIIKSMETLVPPVEIQNKIVKILKTIDEKININKEINKNLLKLSRALFKEFYMDKVESYDVKKYVTLDDVTSKFATGLNPRKNFVLGEGDNYYVTIKNMANNSIVLDDKCASITDEALVKINKRSDLQVGDLLFSGIGTIGRVHLIDQKPTNWNISESVFTMRPNELVSSEFLFIMLLSQEVQEYAKSLASGSVQKGIRMRDLKAFEFILPIEEDKFHLDSLLNPIIADIKSNEKEIRKLTKLRDTLLPKLMSGEIDVSKINYDLE